MAKIELNENAPKTEFSAQFLQGMIDRMGVSFYKYGALEKAYPDHADAIASLMARLRKYAETKNTEYLIDAANFAMIEFMRPRYQEAFFQGTDDSGSPGRVEVGGRANKKTNEELANGE